MFTGIVKQIGKVITCSPLNVGLDVTISCDTALFKMEIGDSILFLKEGKKAWEGSKELIFKTDNPVVNDFVYSSNLMKKIKQVHI